MIHFIPGTTALKGQEYYIDIYVTLVCITYRMGGRASGVARRVLQVLREEPRQTPSNLVKKLRVKGSTVRNCLVLLKDLKLVETPSRGLYQISFIGEKVLEETEG